MTPDYAVKETIERFLATRREGPTLREIVWALPQLTRPQIDAAVSRLVVARGLSEDRNGRLVLGNQTHE
jgi:hypothetical protein